MSMLFLLVSGQQQDDLCPTIRSVLCVKTVLLAISSATKDINEITRKIEQYIVNIILPFSRLANLLLF